MQMNKKQYPISTLFGRRHKIDPTPDYQRPPVWTRKQKQLLIDTILRGYDVPKMYWQRLPKGRDFEFSVIDGQQRLRAIWEFCDGLFPLPEDSDPVNGVSIARQRYSELDTDLSSEFDIYSFDVVIVEDAIQNEQEDEIREMFLRLQNGTTLKSQEKRNAMIGKMRDFVKDLAKHDLFENCKFTNSRFTFDHMAAQITCLEIAGGPSNIRDSDLNRLYNENKKFDSNGKTAKKILRVLDYLLRAFPEKTPELERYNVIALYCLSSILLEKFVYNETEDKLRNWFLNFEANRRENENLEEDKRDSQLIEYRRLTSQSTDTEESIRSRLEVLEGRFFEAYPEIEPLHEARSFSHEQRLAIYRRDGGQCQIKTHCDGGKLPWDGWHADHVIAHVRGGRTVVSNGQVSCPSCNLTKSSTN